jgi:hypothetical protein
VIFSEGQDPRILFPLYQWQRNGNPINARPAPPMWSLRPMDEGAQITTLPADSETWKSAPVRHCVGVAGERSYCADHRRATLHAGMGDVLEIVRSETVFQQRGRDGRNRQPVSAIRAGEQETR